MKDLRTQRITDLIKASNKYISQVNEWMLPMNILYGEMVNNALLKIPPQR